MDKTLKVTFTFTVDKKPLALVCNLPGGDAYLTPQNMRFLAAALVEAADECEAQPVGKKHFIEWQKEYPLWP